MRFTFCVILVCASFMSLSSKCLAQEGPKVKGTKVYISGENPFIELAKKPGEKPTTNVSFWRVVYSPAGMGHACYITSDLTGNGPSAEDLRVVFTDNEKLVDYLNREIMSVFNKDYLEKPFPILKASFSKEGSTLSEYRENIKSDQHRVELVWKNFYPTVLLEIPVGPLTITTTLIPALNAEVHIDGIKAVGNVFPRPEGTAQGSTGALAFSETWVK